jgi:hypothetical protein
MVQPPYTFKSNNDMTGLDYLSLALYLYHQQESIITENNGYWINIFNYLTPLNKNDQNIYPLMIYNDYDILPENDNTILQLKVNNITKVIEWKNNKFYNLIHYRFFPINNYNDTKSENDYLQFLNEDRIGS